MSRKADVYPKAHLTGIHLKIARGCLAYTFLLVGLILILSLQKHLDGLPNFITTPEFDPKRWVAVDVAERDRYRQAYVNIIKWEVPRRAETVAQLHELLGPPDEIVPYNPPLESHRYICGPFVEREILYVLIENGVVSSAYTGY